MSRETTRKALHELRAVIGGGNLMTGLKSNFGVRSFHEVDDDKMQQVETWARQKLANETKAKPDLNPERIYARWNKRKAGVRVKNVRDGE